MGVTGKEITQTVASLIGGLEARHHRPGFIAKVKDQQIGSLEQVSLEYGLLKGLEVWWTEGDSTFHLKPTARRDNGERGLVVVESQPQSEFVYGINTDISSETAYVEPIASHPNARRTVPVDAQAVYVVRTLQTIAENI